MLIKHIMKPALLFSLLSLGACGGGSGSGKQESSLSSSSKSTVSSSLSSSTISSSQSSISSSSVLISSSSSTQPGSSSISSAVAAASVKVSGNLSIKDENGVVQNDSGTDDISVEISLLNEQQDVIKSNRSQLLGSVGLDGSRHGFSDQLSASGAAFVVVHIAKPGYTDFARRFEFAETIELSAELLELPEARISAAEAQTISGVTVNGFNVSVSDNSLGETGNALGEELSVFIPQSALPAGTDSLNVRMKAYDPTQPEEAAFFPGAYEDSDGNKLLSIAFNYADITTDTGVSLRQVAQKTRSERIKAQKSGRQQKTQAADPVVINRLVPEESCNSLAVMGDSDKSLDGFQIPVYTYNPTSGLWDLLGQGSLFDEAGQIIPADFKSFACSSVSYTLEIKVTNEIFISNWWNLDYPLVFEEPQTVCANLKLLDEGGLPLVGAYAYVSDDDNDRSFSASSFVTDAQGQLKVSLVRLNNDDTDSSANLSVYSVVDGTLLQKPIELSTAACANTAPVVPVTLSIPARCTLEGKLLNPDSAPFSDGLIIAYPENGDEFIYSGSYAYTKADGTYAMNLFCAQDYRILDYTSWVSEYLSDPGLTKQPLANVNNIKGADEIVDDGKKVQFKDLTVSLKPWGFVYVAGDDNSLLEIDLYYSGKNFPVVYSFDVIDTRTSQVIKHFEGTVEENAFESFGAMRSATVSIKHEVPIPPANEYLYYSIKGEVIDGKNTKGVLQGWIFNSSNIE